MSASASVTVDIQRSAFTQQRFDKVFEKVEDSNGARRPCSSLPGCSARQARDILFKRVPCMDLLCTYPWKQWLGWDILAGLSLAVIHIPQGMGFALVTNVPPALGLYSSIFPVILYCIFGTSRHISIGTMAVISIMIGAVVNREVEKMTGAMQQSDGNSSALNGTFEWDPEDKVAFQVDIATSVTLLMGIFQILMSILRLGRIGCLMSSTFIGGFLTGSAVLIITSQVPNLLGLKLAINNGFFRVPHTWYAVFSNITDVNLAELVVSTISILILVIVKIVIVGKLRKKINFPIPIELLVVILATVISYFTDLHGRYDIKVVGEISNVIPAPSAPSLYNASSYIMDSLSIALVSFTLSISMAKMMSTKHGYRIDNDQEMLAYGLSFAVSSFFHCFGGAQAPPRTLIHESSGGKSQLAGLFSSAVVLMVCLFLGHLFESVPNAVLSSIIIVALLPLFVECSKLRYYWRINRYDLVIWLVTFLCVGVVDISLGLVIGISLSVVTVVAEAFLTKGQTINGCSAAGELYRSPTKYNLYSKQQSSIRIFSYTAPLFFANVEKFSDQLFVHTEFNPSAFVKQEESVSPKENGEAAKDVALEKRSCGPEPHVPAEQITAVVLDFAGITYIDLAGLELIKLLHKQYKAAGVDFALAGCRESVLNKLHAHGYTELDEQMDLIFPSVHDACMIIGNRW